MALNKQVLVFTDDRSSLPFDVRPNRSFETSKPGDPKARQALLEFMLGLRQGVSSRCLPVAVPGCRFDARLLAMRSADEPQLEQTLLGPGYRP